MADSTVSRRRFVAGLATAGLSVLAPIARGAPRPVVVLTSYPDELVSRFEAAFEKAHPEYRLQAVWRMPHDAAPYLRQPGQGGVDVYWAASPRTFAALARDGAWRMLTVDRAVLPATVGNTALADVGNRYVASELAGYGFAVAPQALAERGLPLPGDWPDLADGRLFGQIALPIPARVGFAPPMVEIVLQAFGWEAGWALWSQIVANARLVERGSTFVSEEVAAGRCAVGVSIDFFVNSAIANGAPLQFIYPRHTGVNPAHVAITAGSPNPAGAQAFVDFLLSRPGQSLLAHPDIRRLPVRPDAYAKVPDTAFNPFAAAAAGGLGFDSDRARPRLSLTAALFQQMLVAPHRELQDLWSRLRRVEQGGRSLPELRRLLGEPPLTEAEAADPELRRQLGERLEGDDGARPVPVEAVWAETCRRRRSTVRQGLEALGA